jgi:NAD(P)-dependent dehydrogenase (short-subunit alcohol dehydrogenase family)
MGRLDGKAAIITGGEGFIGMATARVFIAEGANVFLAGISESDLKAGAASLGERADWQVADTTDSGQVKAAVDAAVDRFGRLDVVIANAGIKGATAPIADYPEDSRGIRVNTIHPGPVDNDFQHTVEEAATGADRQTAASIFDGMIPLGRHAGPSEIARAMLFLASDDSSFMTGATLAVDGGMSS